MVSVASRRPVLSAAAAYAALALLFIGPALLPGRTLSNSDFSYFSPPWNSNRPADLQHPSQTEAHDWSLAYNHWLRYSRSEAPGIPLWNPYAMAGRPYVGSAQPAPFSPYTLLTLLLPYDFAVGFMAALKLFVAALGMFLLARALALRWAGAFVAGLVFSFGMPLVTWLMEADISAVWSLIPLLLLATWRVATRPGVGPVCGLAIITALVFTGGHPESIAQAFAGATAFLIFVFARERHRASRRARRVVLDSARFLGGVGWGAALAAVAIGPAIELVLRSSDIAERGITVHRRLPGGDVITLMLPDWWSRGTNDLLAGQPLGRFLYVGALPLILVVLALLRPTWERAALALFAFLCGAVVFALSPFSDLANMLPGLSRTDNTRLVIVGLPALALLAGRGFDDMRRPVVWARARIPLVVAGALLVLPVALYFGLGNPLSHVLSAVRLATSLGPAPTSLEAARLAAVVLWLVMAGSAFVLLALRYRGRIPAGLFAALGILLVVLDLFRAGMGFNPSIPRSHATQPVTGAIRYLQSRRPARYVGVGAMGGNSALSYRLYDAAGYQFPIERRYRNVWYSQVNPAQAFLPGFSSPVFVSAITPASLHGLGLFGVQDIVVDPAAAPLSVPGLTVAYRGADATVYHNDSALPRAFVVGGEQSARDDAAAFTAFTAPSFDGRRTLIRQGAARPPSDPPGPAGTATIEHYAADRVEISADATRAGTLVLGDVWFPGWQATVDGHPNDVERVDYLFRGVRVGPGRHRVVFSYRPASWRVSLAITTVALLALVAGGVFLVTGRRRRRKGSTLRATPSGSSANGQ